ncbi:hypothetical protein [Enterobacter soli]|uniref:hypothetical protein n=1 Tax=Enterobacter soli TaxID=885040 RepID=UPI0035E3C837
MSTAFPCKPHRRKCNLSYREKIEFGTVYISNISFLVIFIANWALMKKSSFVELKDPLKHLLEGTIHEKQEISGHKNASQTARYNRKITVVPVVGGAVMPSSYGEVEWRNYGEWRNLDNKKPPFGG